MATIASENKKQLVSKFLLIFGSKDFPNFYKKIDDQ